jgi:hypothetical protein
LGGSLLRDDVRVAGVVFEDEGRGMERGGGAQERRWGTRKEDAMRGAKARVGVVCANTGLSSRTWGVAYLALEGCLGDEKNDTNTLLNGWCVCKQAAGSRQQQGLVGKLVVPSEKAARGKEEGHASEDVEKERRELM